MAKPWTMAVTVDGRLRPGTTAKDLVLAIIGAIDQSRGFHQNTSRVPICGSLLPLNDILEVV